MEKDYTAQEQIEKLLGLQVGLPNILVLMLL